MSMPFQLHTKIITEGKEKRLDNNDFQLQKEGYHLYAMNEPILVERVESDDPIGEGMIHHLQFVDNKTIITYKLTNLKTIN